MFEDPQDERAVGNGSGQSQTPALREIVIEDVWSRTEPRYRRRAAALLLINAAVFAGLNVFAYWLQTLRAFDFSLPSYGEAMRLDQLTDFTLGPIGIEKVPMMILIVGLTVGVMIVVPIVVAQLYRLPCSLVFVAEVFLLAHMRVLALFLLAGCVIAGSKRTRLQFKYASTLLGLLPVLLYFYLGTRGATPHLGAEMLSDDLLLLAPWAVAVLSAAVVGGIIMLIARIVVMRPGAIAPVLTLCFAVPVVLFQQQVGRDQLRYLALYHAYSDYSPERGETAVTKRELAKYFSVDPSDEKTLRYRVAEMLPGITRHVAELRATRQDEVSTRCDEFLAEFASSPYVPHVLYLKGWALDLRANADRLETDLEVEYYYSFPAARSAPTWRLLVEQYPNSRFAMFARLQLARLALRRERATEALAYLRAILNHPSSRRMSPGAGSFSADRSFDRSWRELRPEIRRQADRLAYLVAKNGDDPTCGNRGLAELMRLDPRSVYYRGQLRALAAEFRDTGLADNLRVALARCENDPRRQLELLRQCVDDLDKKDAGADALFAMGNVLRRLAAENKDEKLREEAQDCYRRLIDKYPDTPYAREARGLVALAQPRD